MKCLQTTCHESWCECVVCLMIQDPDLADEIKAKVPGLLPLPGRWSLVQPQPSLGARVVTGLAAARLCVFTVTAPVCALGWELVRVVILVYPNAPPQREACHSGFGPVPWPRDSRQSV